MQSIRHFSRANIFRYAAVAIVVQKGVRYFLKTRSNGGPQLAHQGDSRPDLVQTVSDLQASPHSFESSTLRAYDLDKEEDRTDQMVEDSFPASDPPSYGHTIAQIRM